MYLKDWGNISSPPFILEIFTKNEKIEETLQVARIMGKKSNIEIKIKDSSGAERAIRKFKRMCDLYGVGKEYKKRKEYKKPSERKKEKDKASAKRRTKNSR